jgi:hypothetical protein
MMLMCLDLRLHCSDHEGSFGEIRGRHSESVISGQSGKRNGSQSASDHEPAPIGVTGHDYDFFFVSRAGAAKLSGST